MKYDVIIFKGTGLTDYADTTNPAIVLPCLTSKDMDDLSRIVETQKELVVCFLPHKENG